EPLVKKLLDWYANDPDAGVHSAIDWLLRHKNEGPMPRALDWGQAEALERIDHERAGKEPPPGNWAEKERVQRPVVPPKGQPGGSVKRRGRTMVTFPGLVEFEMGPPPPEEGRLTNETPPRRRISRRFAVASKLVTSEQWQQFIQEQPVTWKAAVTPFGGGYA